MMNLEHMRGLRIAIMGLGKTGLSVAHALSQAGVEVCVWDDSEEKNIKAEQEGLIVKDLRVMPLDNLTAILWSPGVPHTYPIPHPVAVRAKASSIPLISDIEILMKTNSGADILAVTGTNGKSTTTALMGHVLNHFRPTEIGGNIGRPVLDMPILKQGSSYVLELSSYQIELTPSLSPSGVILLNITPDHLARHGGMEGYIAAKERIFDNPPLDARKPTAVICIDTKPCLEIADRLNEKGVWSIIPVSTQKILSEGVYVENGILYELRENTPIEITDLNSLTSLKGQHNHENIACVYALLRQLYGIDPQHIINQIKTFDGLPHRQYLVRTINGIAYINDSKATNAEATARALACYRRIYWILGGQPKEGGLTGLDEFLPRIEKAYLIGDAAQDFGAWLQQRHVPVEYCGTLDVAIQASHLDAQAGLGKPGTSGSGVVLLSPACASWDQFQSFEHRGEVFSSLVMSLPEKGSAE
ncbi:MAG TPA: UDP-N-acetylmuramoyl-L-alanine--D-glutamate ligase [Alphaproteobacteria bacterium]|jgi:UDP-N-acetylmuramoylalanine--D-glutamate ligase|nr:UDP-N-acetylmuramoyl-L-alanine--D-glutamate ligase [Alphaproteobacteria bacterium]HRK97156.1 UDP-N-acetylmuramoyl-L-alanine--D-glutamate ligase [Alphaproteobacteria bacterium]